jgi:hypothetical protein
MDKSDASFDDGNLSFSLQFLRDKNKSKNASVENFE